MSAVVIICSRNQAGLSRPALPPRERLVFSVPQYRPCKKYKFIIIPPPKWINIPYRNVLYTYTVLNVEAATTVCFFE